MSDENYQQIKTPIQLPLWDMVPAWPKNLKLGDQVRPIVFLGQNAPIQVTNTDLTVATNNVVFDGSSADSYSPTHEFGDTYNFWEIYVTLHDVTFLFYRADGTNYSAYNHPVGQWLKLCFAASAVQIKSTVAGSFGTVQIMGFK